MKLWEAVANFHPKSIVSIHNSYGVIFIGQARFVGHHFDLESMSASVAVSGNKITFV